MAAAEHGNATSLPGKPQRILDGVTDCVLADAITCSRHGCRASWSLISSKPWRKKGQSPTSVIGRRTRQRDKPAIVEFSPQIVWIKSPSCLRSGKRTPPSFWPSTSPHGSQGCSQKHAAQVHDGTVTKFLLIPIKTKKSSASMNSKEGATARRWCPLQKKRKKNCTSRKKHPITKLQGAVVFRRGITLGHPQPAMDDPMNCSLASTVVSS